MYNSNYSGAEVDRRLGVTSQEYFVQSGYFILRHKGSSRQFNISQAYVITKLVGNKLYDIHVQAVCNISTKTDLQDVYDIKTLESVNLFSVDTGTNTINNTPIYDDDMAYIKLTVPCNGIAENGGSLDTEMPVEIETHSILFETTAIVNGTFCSSSLQVDAEVK